LFRVLPPIRKPIHKLDDLLYKQVIRVLPPIRKPVHKLDVRAYFINKSEMYQHRLDHLPDIIPIRPKVFIVNTKAWHGEDHQIIKGI